MISTLKVSVIVTNYNTSEYIERCLTSILNQSYWNIECIVVDDASTDNSVEVISKFPVTLIQHTENKGSGKARQTGIDVATGDFIMFVDSDDYISQGFIEELMSSAKEGIDIVIGKVSTDRFKCDVEEGLYDSLEDKIDCFWKHHSCFLGVLVKKSLFDNIKYCPRRIIEDTPTIYKLLYYSNLIKVVNRNECYYATQREGQITSTTDSYKYFIFYCLALIDIIWFYLDKGEKEILGKFIPEFKVQKIYLESFKDERFEKEYNFISNFYNKLLKK